MATFNVESKGAAKYNLPSNSTASSAEELFNHSLNDFRFGNSSGNQLYRFKTSQAERAYFAYFYQ
jgi:hypothetical protein